METIKRLSDYLADLSPKSLSFVLFMVAVPILMLTTPILLVSDILKSNGRK